MLDIKENFDVKELKRVSTELKKLGFSIKKSYYGVKIGNIDFFMFTDKTPEVGIFVEFFIDRISGEHKVTLMAIAYGENLTDSVRNFFTHFFKHKVPPGLRNSQGKVHDQPYSTKGVYLRVIFPKTKGEDLIPYTLMSSSLNLLKNYIDDIEKFKKTDYGYQPKPLSTKPKTVKLAR